MKKKVIIICQTLKEYDGNSKIRKMTIQAKCKILQAVILLTFFFNDENLINISTREMEKMEQLHKKLISQVLNLGRTAPYKRVSKETGSWPCREIINY